ncbi:MAG: type II secretion system protein GspG [Phycisphaerales bacterium]|nr:MAG: type II secretion system protein GspG [Phycisphaerales bacterium]
MRHTRRHFRRSAFTIIEVLVIVAIIGIIATVIVSRLGTTLGQSKRKIAQTNATALASAIKRFTIDCRSLEPGDTLDILLEAPGGDTAKGWQGPYIDNADVLLDPWGRQFVLIVPGNFNTDFDVVSYGSDGVEGGEGEAADVIHGKRD